MKGYFEKSLLPLYRQHLNLQNAIFAPIVHDDAMVAIVYQVTQPNGRKFILKICESPNNYSREVHFLCHFAGNLPVPRIINLVEPQANMPGAILMEYLPGKLLEAGDLTDAVAYEMGSLLACIHNNCTSGYGDVTQPKGLNSNPRYHFNLKFEEGLEECEGHLPPALLERSRQYYESHIQLLDSVDGPCMIHRDFRPGNIMISDGKIRGIIDWSSGRASFAEDDFCPLEHGEWPLNQKSKSSFLSGYANIRPVPQYHTIMPLLRLNRAVAVVGFTVKRGTWASQNAGHYQLNRQFLEAFFS
ncbi:MAG: uncharacterized protein K0S07_1162 [Chlamydiales bacterium]|jgi:Ser/Thr protein kinase RdoA (MazF antagonist)|nr:uncharacterized protein [Chlamydiales bacterium]